LFKATLEDVYLPKKREDENLRLQLASLDEWNKNCPK